MHLTPARRRGARRPSPVTIFFILLALAALAAAQTLPLARRVASAAGPRPDVPEGAGEKAGPRARLSDSYGKLPLRFEANRGQAPRGVRFLSRGSGYLLLLTEEGAVLNLRADAGRPADENRAPDAPASAARRAGTLRFNLLDSKRRPRIVGLGELAGRSNHLIGDDPRAWRTGVENFERVKYEAVYPGVDLVYYGREGQLEYDFVVAPGADPARIGMTFGGARSVRIDEGGDLVLNAEGGEVRQRKPFAYQEVGGRRREVAARYVKDARGAVRFRLGGYDRRLPLIIDPVILYSSYLGGDGDDQGWAVAVGPDGSAYIAGQTLSTDFSGTTPGAGGASQEAFVLKLSPDGKSLVYATFLGGRGDDAAFGLAVDAAGSAYVAGQTNSDDFPHTPGALQEAKDALIDAFVTKLDPSGSSLVYSTFCGGNISEAIFGIAVDAAGNSYVAGHSGSTRFDALPSSAARSGNPISKSTDAAANWSGSDAGLESNAVNAFAFDPSNSNVLYAATSHGLFKSIDAGAHWALTGGGNPATAPPFASAVAVDPSNPAVVYAGGPADVLFKSTDGGARFETKTGGILGTYNALLVDPAAPSTLYAGTSEGFFKSVNGGENWLRFEVTPSLLPSVNELALDPSNSSVLYAGTSRGMFKSTNAGTSWSEINSGLRTAGGAGTPNALAVSQSSPQTLYVAVSGFVTGVFKSTDGGANWSRTGAGQNFRPTVRVLAVDPTNPSVAYAGTQFEVYKTTDGGASWVPSSGGLTTRVARALAIDPRAPSTVYLGGAAGSDALIAKLNPTGSALGYFLLLGGFQSDNAFGIALDTAGNAYVAGNTLSTNFPVVAPFQSTLGGDAFDAFVAKVNADGASLAYSTYLGGSSSELGSAVAVDAQGSAYVTGLTFSSNFPVANALQPASPGFENAFVTKLSPDGRSLVYSTYLGGSDYDDAFDIAVDAQGSAYVAGVTASDDFPVVEPAQAKTFNDDAYVAKLNPAGSALVYSTPLGGSGGTEVGNSIALDAAGNAYVVGNTLSGDFPVVGPLLPRPAGGGDAFIAKIGVGAALSFAQNVQTVEENSGSFEVSVRRLGDTSGASTVDYTTLNGSASDRSDYTAAVGTLRFAAGETQKSFRVLLTDDALDEFPESLSVVLSNPQGAVLAPGPAALIFINDNDNGSAPNPIDRSDFFVRQHYHDFFSREPDAPGLAHWTNVIESCGTDLQCREVTRINVSGAFFLSIEFKETGYLVERIYKAAYGDATGTSTLGGTPRQLQVPIIRLEEFLPDTQRIGQGVVVNQGDWQGQIEANKTAFTQEFVRRQRFVDAFPLSMTPAQFVGQLNQRAGNPLDASERQALIDELTANNTAAGRASVLRKVAEDPTLEEAERNRAFVLMQYFGYLRRNPNDPPDADYTGYDFWLGNLEKFNGNFVQAELVKAFIQSVEYRQRFGQ